MVEAKILIVEDENIVALDIKNRVEQLGYDACGIVATGEEAIRKTDETLPDLVLMDIKLKSDMDGIEAAEKIRDAFNIPVVFLTAYADDQALERAKVTEPSGYLTKPLKNDDLHSAIEIALYKHRLETRLRESEEKYRELVENINDVIYSVDENGVVTYISSVLKRVMGYDSSEIINRNFADFIHKDDLPRILERLEEVFSGDLGPTEYRLLAKSGEYHWIRSSSRPIYEGDRVVGLRGVFTDITEQKQLEAQLQQAQKMESIGTLAGGIAHDFNNILGIIIGNTELAIDDVPEWNPAKACLEEIRSASLRAKDVVRHILSFARKSITDRKPVRISPIIQDSLKLLRASIPTTIEIRQNLSCESDTVLADPTQINQVLMNLCTNAAHAMAEEGGVLDVSLEDIALDEKVVTQFQGLSPGNYVKLTVRDTGPGMDPGVIDRIFDPYFTTKGVGEGTGMGLSVAHGIVKNHDGVITVNSEPGKGTIFEVLLPCVEAEAEPEPEETEALPRGDERILYVDDEESLLKIGKRMLERLGYDALTVTSPVEALDVFSKGPDQFDLVITDMTMPQMTGEKLARELMKIRPHIPIILSTGFSEQMDEEKAAQMGIRAFVMKPLVMKNMANTVRKVLDEK